VRALVGTDESSFISAPAGNLSLMAFVSSTSYSSFLAPYSSSKSVTIAPSRKNLPSSARSIH